MLRDGSEGQQQPIGRRPRIIYWNNMPTPYVVERFNALADRGNLEFEAWFSEERESDRSWNVDESTWRFSARYLGSGRKILGRSVWLPFHELAETKPDLLITAYDKVSPVIGSVAARGVGARIAYRALPEFESWAPRTWYRKMVQRFLFRGADGAKVPGEMGAAMAVRLGLPSDRVWRVTQSIDVQHYRRARNMPSAQRASRRSELGLAGCVFIYTGRLWTGKGFDYLLEAYARLQASGLDVSLLVVGDGTDKERYRALAAGMPRVVFTGFVQPADLPEYYALADVMVFPTLGDPHGLVLEEALAAGLPVISTSAAGDVRTRLPEGIAGFVVEPASASSLSLPMRTLAESHALRTVMANRTWNLVKDLNPAQFARDFETFVAHLLAQPERRTPEAFIATVFGHLLVLVGSKTSLMPRGRQVMAPDGRGLHGNAECTTPAP